MIATQYMAPDPRYSIVLGPGGRAISCHGQGWTTRKKRNQILSHVSNLLEIPVSMVRREFIFVQQSFRNMLPYMIRKEPSDATT